MRDQVDSDITIYLYSVIEFIEDAISENPKNAKILVHCFKVFLKCLIRIGQFTFSLCHPRIPYVEERHLFPRSSVCSP
jgi:hypothetical protein